MEVLNEIWKNYRMEGISFGGMPEQVQITRQVTADIFRNVYRNVRNDQMTSVALVVFGRAITFGAPLCRKLLSLMEPDNQANDTAIPRPDHLVILCDKTSNKVLQMIREVDGMYGELFFYSDFSFNKLQNQRQPRFEIVKPNELKEAYAEIGTDNMQKIPRIRIQDDISARLMGLRHQDLVRLVRGHPVVGIWREYRYANDRMQVEEADDVVDD
jgi:DNA-directed RNA polymerase subunit H (RpoH/RPB5)